MKKNNSTDQQFAKIEEGLSKTEQFIEANRNKLVSFVTVIVFIFIAFYGYHNFYKKPMNERALDQLFIAEQYFEKDSFEIALNGNEVFKGLIEITQEYSNTKSGELAKYYAGISYLRLNDYPNAIKMLDGYKSDDKLLLSIAKSAIGDAFSELNQPQEALEYYEKAINTNQNALTTPIILMKSARLYELEKNYQKANDCYTKIQSEYPESSLAQNIEKYINKINAQ